MSNYTYIVRCADGTFYTGWTTCLERRLAAHNRGTGAKYTRARRPAGDPVLLRDLGDQVGGHAPGVGDQAAEPPGEGGVGRGFHGRPG